MPRRKTDKQFKQEVYNLVGNSYEVLSKYVNAKTKVKMRHVCCGYEWKISPDQFLRGERCPKCSARKRSAALRYNTAIFKAKVKAAVGNEYDVIGTYVNSNTKITMRHNCCGNVWDITPAHFLGGRRCPICQRKELAARERKSANQFKREFQKLVGNSYSLITDYVNAKTKIKVRHNSCGYTYCVTPHDFLSGHRCPKCYGHIKKDTTTFKAEVKKVAGNGYLVLGNYVNSKTKIKMKHVTCGYTWEITPEKFLLRGERCPQCTKRSRGELFIDQYLTRHHIAFERQKTFPDLRDQQLLSYDFFVNKQVLIEYQGGQHYHCVKHFGGKQQFAVQQKHDAMKADYAATHGYLLLAIPYRYDTQAKVDRFLDTHLPCIL